MVDAVRAHQRGEDPAEAADAMLTLTVAALETATVRLVMVVVMPPGDFDRRPR